MHKLCTVLSYMHKNKHTICITDTHLSAICCWENSLLSATTFDIPQKPKYWGFIGLRSDVYIDEGFTEAVDLSKIVQKENKWPWAFIAIFQKLAITKLYKIFMFNNVIILFARPSVQNWLVLSIECFYRSYYTPIRIIFFCSWHHLSLIVGFLCSKGHGKSKLLYQIPFLNISLCLFVWCLCRS